MPVVTLPDGSTRAFPAGTTAADVARAIGPRLADAAIGARINDRIFDLSARIPGDCSISILTASDPDALRIIRHSCAHVMAEAICMLCPETKLVYGPPVDIGFYYDIDLPRKLTPDDYPAIEREMQRIIDEDRPFTRYELPRDQAMRKLQAEGNPYKVENAERAKGDVLSFYVTGPEPGRYWEDLCMGTHVPSTGRIGAFKLMNVAGAFLHGDETKQQLQRVYGTAFATRKELDAYLAQVEEAKKRDHRKIGQDLNLFTIDPLVGSGMVLWKPRGATMRLVLENMLRAELVKAGYQPVFTPNIGRLELYRTSGHLLSYQDKLFPPLYETPTARILNELWVIFSQNDDTERLTRLVQPLLAELQAIDPATWRQLVPDPAVSDPQRLRICGGCGEHNRTVLAEHLAHSDGYLLKPMNCPHHVRIYASEPHSYRDMPVRLAEFGTVYRFEQSGELCGMVRVRGFTQDDAHLFVTPEQLEAEIQGCLRLTRFVLDAVGLTKYSVRVGLHDPADPKYINNPEGWKKSEAAVIHAAQAAGLSATHEVGEAAFYGPKIDFVVNDCIGREWQLGTVQADYNLPERFGLEYIAADGRSHRPIMIHRAPFGSMERFCGILIEHCAGAFPAWLAPVQAVVATISEKSEPYGREVAGLLCARGIRIETDFSPERIGYKKHAARQLKAPYILVVGEKEAQQRMVNVNARDTEASANMSLDALLTQLTEESRPPHTA